MSPKKILEKYVNLSPISPVSSQKKHYANELFSLDFLANQVKLPLNFHLPSDSQPKLFALLHVSSYSRGFLKAKHLMVLRTELKRHHSGDLWWVPLAACMDGADPQLTGKWLTPGPTISESPALTSLSIHPLASPCSCLLQMCLAIQGRVPFPSILLHSTAFLGIPCL